MRVRGPHSSCAAHRLILTKSVYTDPQLLDMARALERLPELRLGKTVAAGQDAEHSDVA